MSSYVTINKPYKLKSSKIHGINSNVYTFRLKHEDYDIINNACNKLGTTFSYFVRYCAIEVAKEVKKENTNGI